MKFDVTFDRYTPESIEHGDVNSRGYLVEGVSLREAIEYITSEPSSRCSLDCIEPSDSDTSAARWVTWYYGADCEIGDSITLSLHFPNNTTSASRARLVRFLTKQ